MKILQVLDPAHEHWVQGGTFKDLRACSKFFEDEPLYLGSPFRTQPFFHWIRGIYKAINADCILFSSLTPLENYFRVKRFLAKKQTLAVWFTHQEGFFSTLQLRAMNSCEVVFVHSNQEKSHLEPLISSKVEVTMGAVDFSRFESPPVLGTCIAWVGTPNARKNPEEILRFATENPDLKFRILGKNWSGTLPGARVPFLPNLEYLEVNGPLKSSDLNGCDIYICTSFIEGGPMPMLESIAGNLKIISRDVGFVQDVFKEFGISGANIYSSYEEILPLVNRLRSEEKPRYATMVKTYSFERLATLIAQHFLKTGLKSQPH
jgi:glycosyltransferase involved in cell wall biosynthesis